MLCADPVAYTPDKEMGGGEEGPFVVAMRIRGKETAIWEKANNNFLDEWRFHRSISSLLAATGILAPGSSPSYTIDINHPDTDGLLVLAEGLNSPSPAHVIAEFGPPLEKDVFMEWLYTEQFLPLWSESIRGILQTTLCDCTWDAYAWECEGLSGGKRVDRLTLTRGGERLGAYVRFNTVGDAW